MVMLFLQCPKCDGSESIRKNGHSISGHQRYQCTDCRHTFQTDYSMKGSEPGMHEKIVTMALELPRDSASSWYQLKHGFKTFKKN